MQVGVQTSERSFVTWAGPWGRIVQACIDLSVGNRAVEMEGTAEAYRTCSASEDMSCLNVVASASAFDGHIVVEGSHN